ncbi:MAG TPA: hypothetical protein VLJ21_03755, partial [Candidatus Binatia bacterium]|nr:hypothetical protein [Candidatus Binatia bacterium]
MKRILAALMLALIVSLPIVTAQTFSVQQFSGQDGVRNVARTTDTLTIKALASIPGDAEITPGQVRLTTSDGVSYLFTTCTPQDTAFLCTTTYALVGAGGEDTYTVALFDDDGNEVASKQEALVNDLINPALITLTASPTVLGQGKTTLTYHAEDYSFSPGDTDTCAGVSRIEIYENTCAGAPTASIPGVTEVNHCAIDGTFDYTPQNTGNIMLCAKAFDRLERTSLPKTANITVDRSPPSFTGFRIASQDGVAIHSMTPEGVVANIEVTIKDDSLNVNTIRADFNLLTGGGYTDLGPNEFGDGTTRTVVWNNVPITHVSPCEFTVRATDTLGNTGTRTFSCDIVVDTSPPEFLGATTGFTSADGTMLLGTQGTLTARFQEAGMIRGNAYLDTDGLGLGTRKAESCTRVNGEWQCTWHLPATVPQNRYTLTLLRTTTDDLGNPLAAEKPLILDYDPTPPKLNSGPIVRVFHANEDYGDQLVRGDTLELEYNVSGAASAIGNFSAVGGGLNQGSCSGDTCTFSQEIAASGPYSFTLPLRFVDEAGNAAETTYSGKVFTFLNDANPNYWTSTASCSPKIVDRAAAKLINHQVYCHISLSPIAHPNVSASNVKTVVTSLTTDDCTGELLTSTSSLDLINNGYQSTDPYLRLILD